MASYAARALVLKRTSLGEADLIVTLLAEDGRQIRAVAKGARKPSSRLAGRLQQFAVVDLLLHTGRSLDVVSEAESVAPHAGLREDLDRSAGASAVAEFLDKVSVEGQAEERSFALADATLAVIEGAAPDEVLALVVAFVLKGMALHGYRPQLGRCAACAEGVPHGRFSLDAGGVLCEACGDADPAALRVSRASVEIMRTLLMAKMTEVVAMSGDRDALRESLRLMRSFAEYHLHVRLKALEFFQRTAS